VSAIDYQSIANQINLPRIKMTSNIVRQDISSLLDGWIEAERKGVLFPVPFESAWRIAEYSNKANAKQSGLKSLKKGKQFSSEIMKTPGGGRSSLLLFTHTSVL